MATLTNNTSNPNNQNNSYVHISDYNKLKTKYDNKLKENKKLKENIENLMNSTESIYESKKSVETIFEIIKNILSNNKIFSKGKEEFSTSSSHYEYLGAMDMKTASKSCNCISTNLNSKDYLNINLIKKIEEIEFSYQELLKNFSLLVSKYKNLKEEKLKIDENNITLLNQISTLNEEYNNLYNELNESNITIERFKEIDKCLVDSTINSFFLNSNEKKLNTKEENNKFIPYVLCEPVPTFVKFINKFTK